MNFSNFLIKPEKKRITGVLILPDNIYYKLEDPDDERGLYFTDSEQEAEEEEEENKKEEEENKKEEKEETETEPAGPHPQKNEGKPPTTDTSDEQPSHVVSEEDQPVCQVADGESQEKNGD